MGLAAWLVDSWEVLTRETTAAVTIPAEAAFHLAPTGGGGYLQGQTVPLPDGVAYGDYVNVQAALYVEGATDATAAIQLSVVWKDEDGDGFSPPDWGGDVVNGAFWASEYNRTLVDFPLPLSGFAVASANLLVPSALSGGGHHVTQFQLYIAVADATGVDPWEGADAADLYVTNILVEAATEAEPVTPYYESSATLTAEVLPMVALGTIGLDDGLADLTVYSDLAATVTIGLGGEAWLTAMDPGEDTMQAHGYIHTGSRARMAADDEVLPPWFLPLPPPVYAPDDLKGLIVTVGGFAVKRAAISELTIDLDVDGGPKAATLGFAHDLKRAPKVLDSLVVVYKGQTLFRGRLERINANVDTGAGYTLNYGPSLVALRDHKAYRQVFITTDLQEWQTDQGPRSSPDTFEVASRSSGNTV